jgi:hypothetical protein
LRRLWPAREHRGKQRVIEAMQSKLKRKDEVLAVVVEEMLRLKKAPKAERATFLKVWVFFHDFEDPAV